MKFLCYTWPTSTERSESVEFGSRLLVLINAHCAKSEYSFIRKFKPVCEALVEIMYRVRQRTVWAVAGSLLPRTESHRNQRNNNGVTSKSCCPPPWSNYARSSSWVHASFLLKPRPEIASPLPSSPTTSTCTLSTLHMAVMISSCEFSPFITLPTAIAPSFDVWLCPFCRVPA